MKKEHINLPLQNVQYRVREMAAKAKALHQVLEAISKVWNNNDIIIISTLLLNMSFLSVKAVNFDWYNTYVLHQNIMEAIRSMKDYYSYHVIDWVQEEIQMAWDAAIHTEPEIGNGSEDTTDEDMLSFMGDRH